MAYVDSLLQGLRQSTTTERPSVSRMRQCSNPICARLSNEKFGKCSKCNESYYCSPECQRQDWAVHQIACKKIRAKKGNIVV
jgi:hypothetical protein